MWQFQGHWIAQGSSQRQLAQFEVNEQGWYRIVSLQQEVFCQGQYAHLAQQDQIPGVPLRLQSSQGQLALAADLASEFNAMHRQLVGSQLSHGLSRLETDWRSVLIFTLGALLIIGLFFWRGVPRIADHLAFRVPAPAVQQLGTEVERIMDWRQMQASQLSEQEQQEWLARFAPALALEPQQQWRVEFRYSPSLGANALALPHGVLLFTDDLLALAEEPDEVIGVLLHEMGHVMHRHGLRQVIQTSLWTLAFAMLTGEVGSTAEWLATAPIVLASLNYSRRFEFEADEYAVQGMQALGLDPMALGRILERLTCDDPQDCEAGGWDYLSTHPSTERRIERIERQMSER